MKAVAFDRFGPPEVLRPMVLTVPEPGADEVLVRVCATTVNPLDCEVRAKSARVKRKTGFPRVLGFDLSGVVERVGENARRFKPGDAVYGLIDYRKDGAAAEFVRVREAFLHLKPPSLSHDEAAAVPLAGLTALQGLRLKARMKDGERVLVAGAEGAVGHLAVQVARYYGAKVAATCPEEHAGRVRELGAEDVYPPDGVPDGERFDVIFDTAGEHPYSWAKPRLAPKGRFVSVRPDPGGLLAARLLRLVGVRERCLFVMVLPDPHGLRYLHELIEGGQLRPLIGRVYSLDEVVQAHKDCEAGGGLGQRVVKVAE
jgi:NADPH:quinone reductase-like Zn-dependent oxidoreductase